MVVTGIYCVFLGGGYLPCFTGFSPGFIVFFLTISTVFSLCLFFLFCYVSGSCVVLIGIDRVRPGGLL